MSLTDVQMREAAQNLLIVRQVGVDAGQSVWVPVDADACLFNPLNGEVVPIDDVDVPEGFVVALAVKEGAALAAQKAAEERAERACAALRILSGLPFAHGGGIARQALADALAPQAPAALSECQHCRIASSIVGWPCPFCHRQNREPISPQAVK